jgi:mRNA interferase MazF
MERGEIRWCTFSKPDKRRPALILTRNSAIRFLNVVTVVPITRSIRGVASEVQLTIEDGLETDSAANFYNIQTIAKADVGRFIAHLSPERMKEVDQAIVYALGIETI